MQPGGTDAAFWEDAGRMLARVHLTAVGDKFGWHQDGWLGRPRQENTWTSDGHEFFARRRILRWLPSYTWAESDLSMVWSANRPPISDRFFPAHAEIAPLRDGWPDRMPLLHLRELLSTIAHDDDGAPWPRCAR